MMFFGEFMCMLVFGAKFAREKWKQQHSEETTSDIVPLMKGEAAEKGEVGTDPVAAAATPAPSTVSLRSTLVCFLPALFDVIGTTA